MEHRFVAIRLAEGDSAGVTAVVRIRHGERFSVVLTLNARKPAAGFEYDLDTDATGCGSQRGSKPYAYEIEYQWGYAREAWHKGESDAGELILPFPGSTGHASFPFPRR